MAEPIINKVEDFIDSATEKISAQIPAAREAIDNIVETVKEKAGEYADKAEGVAHNTVDTIKEKVSSFSNDASEHAGEIKTKAEDGVKVADENAD